MNCETIDALTDDYIDHCLDEATSLAFGSHLEQCPECNAKVAALTRLVSDAGMPSKSIEPDRDLWTGVEKRLTIQPTNIEPIPVAARHNRRLVAAMAVAAMILLAFAIGTQYNKFPVPTGVQKQSLSNPPQLDEAMKAYQLAEAEYLQAKEQLGAVLEARKGTLAPETYAVISENLAIMDNAISDVRLALNQDPDNPRLTEMLFATYRTHVQLLQEAASLPEQG